MNPKHPYGHLARAGGTPQRDLSLYGGFPAVGAGLTARQWPFKWRPNQLDIILLCVPRTCVTHSATEI